MPPLELKHIKRYERPEHYFGETYPETYTVFGITRDSSILAQSNFAHILKQLGGESETVLVTRANHWACGWIETIRVHESDVPRLEQADELIGKLNDYAILDEDDFSTREMEAAAEYWQGMSIAERLYWCQEYRISRFAARRKELPNDPTGQLEVALAA